MRKNSKNKCYPDNFDEKISSHVCIDAYPKDINNVLQYISDGNVIKYDNFSDSTVVSITNKYNGDKEPLCVTMDGIDALRYGMEFIELSRKAIDFDLHNAKKYKYLFMLSNMALRNQINLISLYCKGVASEDKDNPLSSRFIIVVSGYDNAKNKIKKCKIHFEVITEESFLFNPSKILDTINKNIKDYPIQVELDKESFNIAIESMNKIKNLNNNQKALFDISEINKSLSLIDEYKK